MSRPLVVLVGPPGSGKTTVGRLLAQRLSGDQPLLHDRCVGEGGGRVVGFRDTDADIEASAGQPIADIFVDHGEEHFRALERDAVRRALAEHDGVLALGGGAVLDPGTRSLLAGHTVVFLDVHVGDAAARVGMNRDRPLLLGNPRAQLQQLMEARRPLYDEVATVTVTTDGRAPDDVVAEVAAALGGAAG